MVWICVSERGVSGEWGDDEGGGGDEGNLGEEVIVGGHESSTTVFVVDGIDVVVIVDTVWCVACGG
jgi:hypothetical protein